MALVSTIEKVNALTASVSSSRSPSINFGSSYVPQLNDVVVFFVAATTTATATDPSGWVNCVSTNYVESTPVHSLAAIYHLVTSDEVTAVTTTYTATNLWNANTSGNVLGVVLRGVDETNVIDAAATTKSDTAVTPHTIPGLSGASLSDYSMVITGVAKDGTGNYSVTLPAGWMGIWTSNSNQGTVIASYETLTEAGVNVSSASITPSGSDEFAAITVAFTAKEPPDLGEPVYDVVLPRVWNGSAWVQTGIWTHTGTEWVKTTPDPTVPKRSYSWTFSTQNKPLGLVEEATRAEMTPLQTGGNRLLERNATGSGGGNWWFAWWPGEMATNLYRATVTVGNASNLTNRTCTVVVGTPELGVYCNFYGQGGFRARMGTKVGFGAGNIAMTERVQSSVNRNVVANETIGIEISESGGVYTYTGFENGEAVPGLVWTDTDGIVGVPGKNWACGGMGAYSGGYFPSLAVYAMACEDL